jgi:DNA-binding response OmpR family regulator
MSEISPHPQAVHRVLVVEDEPHVCELLSDILSSEGLQPHCVQSDVRAFESLRAAGSFACMIVDVNLGSGTTGYDVARYARTISAALPVLFVSGQTSQASFLANGVPGSVFLPKPFTPAELMDRISMLVGDNDA